jgi:transcription elongation factor GreA
VGVGTRNDDLLFTAEGYRRLRLELDMLRTEGRRAMGERLRAARDDGHFDDNQDLFDALEERNILERRIAVLEDRLISARVAEPGDGERAGIGSSVRLRDLETGGLVDYELVGAREGDARRGRISVDAPIGRAVLGAVAGAVITVDSPRGRLKFDVVSVGAEASRSEERKAA